MTHCTGRRSDAEAMTPLEDESLADYIAMLAETARRTGIDVSVVQRVLDVFHEVAEERARERENG